MAVVVVGLDENPINRIMAAEQRTSMGHHRATKPPHSHPAPLPPLHRMTAALLFLVSFTAAAENTKEAAYQSGRNTVDDDDDYFPPTIRHHPLS